VRNTSRVLTGKEDNEEKNVDAGKVAVFSSARDSAESKDRGAGRGCVSFGQESSGGERSVSEVGTSRVSKGKGDEATGPDRPGRGWFAGGKKGNGTGRE